MEEKQNSKNVSIVKDLNGNNIVIINDIVFKGKKSISWKDVEKYLMRYVGELYTIAATNEVVYIGDDYGLGGNDESVYKSEFGYLTIDNYKDFSKVVAPLL